MKSSQTIKNQIKTNVKVLHAGAGAGAGTVDDLLRETMKRGRRRSCGLKTRTLARLDDIVAAHSERSGPRLFTTRAVKTQSAKTPPRKRLCSFTGQYRGRLLLACNYRLADWQGGREPELPFEWAVKPVLDRRMF